MEQALKTVYGGRTRVRVCGMCFSADETQLLLVGHEGIATDGLWWSPAGGGLEFGESAQEALVREFAEETNLQIEVLDLLFVNEHLAEGLHAVELFFEVKIIGGQIRAGHDPETKKNIIAQVKFMSLAELKSLPKTYYHNIFLEINTFAQLRFLKKYRVAKK